MDWSVSFGGRIFIVLCKIGGFATKNYPSYISNNCRNYNYFFCYTAINILC